MKRKKLLFGFIICFSLFILTGLPVYATTTYNTNTKAIYSASKLKRNFGSKTNPKKGIKVASANMPASNGFIYGDFATFNSLASENKLGGTPIYILGTIKQVERLATTCDIYYGAFLIDGCDGYQWCATMDIPKTNFDLARVTYIGKNAYIYGLYEGYSTDLNRPLLDITSIVIINETASINTVIPNSVGATSVIKQESLISTNGSGGWENTQLRADKIVYKTPTGEKYHYDAECAGPNATPINLSQVGKLGPCGTCVLQ